VRLVFLGTPEAAVPSLRALVDAGHEVALVITRPPRRRGRGTETTPSPVHHAAAQLGLRVAHAVADLEGLAVERGVVVAYGAMIPAGVLARIPMLNVHFSLLPRWRGAAPVERAILAGDEETGVAIMSLEPTLDTGPIHLVRRTGVDEKSAHALRAELADLGARALVEVLASAELIASATPQSGEATYAEKLRPEDFRLTPAMSPAAFTRTVRLGRAFTEVAARRVRVTRAHALDGLSAPAGTVALRDAGVVLGLESGAVVLDEVVPEGARAMPAADWWRGARLDPTSATWA
jgi:methionyl-tRNA formyltransferase